MKEKRNFDSVSKRCECGALVYGHSEKHAIANIRLHKKGKKHKELMEIKNLRDIKQ